MKHLPKKQYVGQTITTIEHRFGQHCSPGKHKETNSIIDNSIFKNGSKSFSVEQVSMYQRKTKDELVKILNKMEKYYIKKYNTLTPNGYNISKGGNAQNSLEKKVDAYDVHGIFLRTFNSIVDAASFYGISIGTVSSCCRGVVKIPKIKIIFRYFGESFDKYDIYAKTSRRTPVDKYDLDGNFIKSYNSISDALREINIDTHFASLIIKCCDGRAAFGYDYVWRYHGEPFDKYPIFRKGYRPINCYTLDNTFIKTYVASSYAARDINNGIKSHTKENLIHRVANKERKSTNGFKWFYVDDPLQPDITKYIPTESLYIG